MGSKTQSSTLFGTPERACASGTILIIEDEKLVAWDVEQTLRDYDYHHITVTSSVRGARSLMQMAEINISLVILDLKLQDGDGSVLIEEFLNLGIAVVVMTGYSGFQHHSAPVLYKPFRTSQLIDAVQLFMGSGVELDPACSCVDGSSGYFADKIHQFPRGCQNDHKTP